MARLSARWRRVGVVIVAIVALAVLWPVLADVYSQLQSVDELSWGWALAAVVAIVVQVASNIELHRTLFRSDKWLDVSAPLLAGNAASHLLPGGNAFGAGLQIRLMTVAGFPLTQTMTALGGVTVVAFMFGYVVLPLAVLATSAAGTDIDSRLVLPLWIGVGVLAVVLVLVIAAATRDRPWQVLARAIVWTRERLHRPALVDDLERRLLDERDVVVRTLRAHPIRVAATEVGRDFGDFIALYCALRAAGAHVSLAAALAAFVVSNLAGMIPLTPGGLGFVEAGLTGVITLAGASSAEANLGVATYRLVATWLPCLVGIGLVLWFRHRHRAAARVLVPVTPRALLETEEGVVVAEE